MRKKGDLSLNLIVVAAIALLVLVILSVVFIGKMGSTRKSVDSCAANNGQCVAANTCGLNPDGTDNPYEKKTTHECPEGQECCIKV